MVRPNFQSPSFYDRTARITPWLDRITAIVDGVNPAAERRWLIDQLEFQPDHRLLEIAVGTGNNLPFIDMALGPRGTVIGLDISAAMLRQCHKRLGALDCRAALIESDAARLPFRSDTFDAVLHFGGINAFGDRAGAIAEMMRVARAGATILISDKSLPSTRPRSLRQWILLRVKPRLARPPPVALIPLPESEVDLTWFWGGAAYALSFTNPTPPLPIGCDGWR